MSKIGEYVTHPAADAFPLMQGEEYKLLVADIKANGLRKKPVRYKGVVLDGRNRILALLELGMTIRWEEYDGEDPIGFVVSANIVRRHLNESQRAIVAAKLATLPQGRNRVTRKSAGDVTQAEAAARLNVSERNVQAGRAVLEHGIPELVQAVERGDLAVSAAAELAKQPASKQREAAQHARDRGGAELVRHARPQNDETPTDPRIALVRAIVRVLRQTGATVDNETGRIQIAYGGQLFALELTLLGDYNAAAAS